MVMPDQASSALSGAAAGAASGVALGPVGAAVGGIAGGLYGLATGGDRIPMTQALYDRLPGGYQKMFGAPTAPNGLAQDTLAGIAGSVQNRQAPSIYGTQLSFDPAGRQGLLDTAGRLGAIA